MISSVPAFDLVPTMRHGNDAAAALECETKGKASADVQSAALCERFASRGEADVADGFCCDMASGIRHAVNTVAKPLTAPIRARRKKTKACSHGRRSS
jgi:hypothetical protein